MIIYDYLAWKHDSNTHTHTTHTHTHTHTHPTEREREKRMTQSRKGEQLMHLCTLIKII